MGYRDSADSYVEAFRRALECYDRMVVIAIGQGYTQDQAAELVKVWALLAVASSIDGLN